jgi:hypothetical protein
LIGRSPDDILTDGHTCYALHDVELVDQPVDEQQFFLRRLG